MGRPFEIRREVELPASAATVFDAVSREPAGWLFPLPPVEPRLGGTSADGTVVTAWEPPVRFAVRTEGPDGWFNSLEFVIEARDGGTTVLRYVHSGIIDGDWDAQYDGADAHTDFYLHTLGEYVAHFAGRPVTYVVADSPAPQTRPGQLAAVRAALGIGDGSAVGDPIHLHVPGAEPVDGVVDYLTPIFVGIRTDDGLYRFYGRESMGMPVSAAHHLFAPGTDQARAEQAWQAWLADVLA